MKTGPSGPSPERKRILDYLASRATTLRPAEIVARVHAAVAGLEAALEGVSEAEARLSRSDGQWSIAQVVDHLAQTMIRSAEELRHALTGRRPPGPPVYEGLLSGAAERTAWGDLLDGLRSANGEFEAVLASASNPDSMTGPTAASSRPAAGLIRTILVVNATTPGGRVEPEIFDAELDWKEYALVQRLHLQDHRAQIQRLRGD
jgi:hypothetical protein